MIQLNIIGKGFLHTKKDGGIGFKADNQLYRFADISLGRSSEFTIPDDRHNRVLLDLAGDPAQYGDAMRTRHECQLIHGGGAVMGSLSVTGWQPGEFSCVFRIGDFKWIDDLQGVKLADLPWQSNPLCGWDSTVRAQPANNVTPSLEVTQYERTNSGGWQFFPSIGLNYYLDMIKDATGVNVGNVPGDYRIVLCTLHGGNEHSVTIDITGTTTATVSASGANDLIPYDVTLEWARYIVFGAYVGGGSTTAKAFKALRTINVTFPTTIASNVFLVRLNTSLGKCEVLGGVDSNGNGTPLSGRTIEFGRGEVYAFVPNGFVGIDSGGTYYGWKDILYPLSVAVTVADEGDIQDGDTYYLNANHPDMTVFEFLQSVSRALGIDFWVDGDGVHWVTPGKNNIVKVEDIITVERVMRNVGMWGDDTAKAVVRFDSEDYVEAPIVAEYGIDNGNLDGVEEYKSSFSEGSQGEYAVLIDDVEVDGGTPKVRAKRCTLTAVDPNSEWLQRLPQPYVADCEDIAANSTHVTVKCKSNEAAFFALKHDDMLNVRGQLYRWASAQWSGGVMTLDLQRISQGGGDVKRLPYDAEVEYLESTGTQYIDTGIVVAKTDVIIADVQFLTEATTTYNTICEAVVSNSNSIFLRINKALNRFYIRFGNTVTTQSTTDIGDNRNVYRLSKGEFYINGSLHDTFGYKGMPDVSLVIGRVSSNAQFVGKLHSFIIQDVNDVTRLDLIPVRVGTTGYMYDRVSGQLFGNAGTGDFIVGPDKN
jgi:hypothetical protein